MNMLAQALALQAASEAIKHQEEKRKIAQFCRLNATTQRNLPHLPDDVNPLNVAIGMVNAITSGASDGGGAGGQNGGEAVAGAGTGGASNREAQTVSRAAGGEASQGSGEAAVRQGPVVTSNPGVVAGAGRVDSAAGSGSDSRRPRNWAIPWIVATGASILGAGGVGFGISNSLNRVTNPPDTNLTVVEGDSVNSQYPILDWAMENGWHLK